jgi:hypothetical protein
MLDMKWGAILSALVVVLTACSAKTETLEASTAASLSPPTSAAPAANDADAGVADAAQAYVLQNLMAQSFQTAKCAAANQGTPQCWQPWVTGLTFQAGVLRVMVQAPAPDNQAVGENAARAVANFIKLGNPPPALARVNWVEATDGPGNHIAQYAVR